MQKGDLNVHVFQNKTNVAQNLIINFFLTLTVRGPFHSNYIKYGGTRLFLKKRKLCMQDCRKYYCS